MLATDLSAVGQQTPRCPPILFLIVCVLAGSLDILFFIRSEDVSPFSFSSGRDAECSRPPPFTTLSSRKVGARGPCGAFSDGPYLVMNPCLMSIRPDCKGTSLFLAPPCVVRFFVLFQSIMILPPFSPNSGPSTVFDPHNVHRRAVFCSRKPGAAFWSLYVQWARD